MVLVPAMPVVRSAQAPVIVVFLWSVYGGAPPAHLIVTVLLLRVIEVIKILETSVTGFAKLEVCVRPL